MGFEIDYVTSETQNSYNAEIIEALNTPEKRLEMVKLIVRQNFIVSGQVKYYGMTEYKARGEEEHEQASIYWAYTFRTPSIESSYRMHTATVSNCGHLDFNLHALKIK